MNKAVFFDRDGVINKERGDYTYRVSDFEILPGVIEFAEEMQKRGYLLFVITNQGGIAKGIYTHEDFRKVNDYMLEQFKKNGVSITGVYYCPHFSETGKCLCRKPDSLLLEKAAARFNVDLKHSYFIGDRNRDVQAGEKVGLNTIKVASDSSLFTILEKIS